MGTSALVLLVILGLTAATLLTLLILWCLHLPNHAGILIAYPDCKKHIDHLEFERKLELPAKSPELQNQDCFNPTLFRDSSHVVCVQRSRTYAPGFPLMNARTHDLVTTYLPLQALGHDWHVPVVLKQNSRFSVGACQDARYIATVSGRVLLLASHKEHAWVNTDGVWRHAIMELSGDASRLERTSFLEIPAELGTTNKNWTVFEHQGRWLVHTHSWPALRLFQLEHSQGTDLGPDKKDWRLGKEVARVDTGTFFSGVRVGSQPVAHVRGTSNWLRTNQETYLTVLHFAHPQRNSFPGGCLGKTYRSLFVEFDAETFEPVARTEGLCFGHECQNVQFASSLMWLDDAKERLAVGYGLMDKASWVGVISLAAIRDKQLQFIH
jgi:hypothetical protein